MKILSQILANPITLCYNPTSMITKEKKATAISKLARGKQDVGSSEVQISILTDRIKEVTEHVKEKIIKIPRAHRFRFVQKDHHQAWLTQIIAIPTKTPPKAEFFDF